MECPVKALTGLCCPGCGGTRMLLSLLRGRWADAVHYNAVSLVFLVLFGWVGAAWVVGRVRSRKVSTWLDWTWSRYATLAVVAVWFVVRNIPAAGLYV